MTAPALSQFQNGISQVSGDNLETFNQTCNVVANLRGFIGTAGITVYLRGYTAINDGGQGQFYWNATGTGPDDAGVTAVVPNGAAVGCWSRSPIISQQLLGTTTNNNSLAGYVGEYISSFILLGSAVSLSTTADKTVTSISLTAGDWDVYYSLKVQPANSTVITILYGSLSTTTNVAGGSNIFGSSYWSGSVTGNGSSILLSSEGSQRFSLASTTTIYAVSTATFATSTCVAWGGLWARRRR